MNWLEMERLAKAHHLEPRTHSEAAVRRYLEAWWCFKYTRPFKDPLLQEYTTDELIYEYMRHYFVDNDPRVAIEAAKRKAADDDWIRKQLEKVAADNAAVKAKPPTPPVPEPGPDLSTTIKFEPTGA
jgi:hypothetical protein